MIWIHILNGKQCRSRSVGFFRSQHLDLHCLQRLDISGTTLFAKAGYIWDYCPFDITWEDIFCLAFYLKWKYFILIDHILLRTINSVFSLSVFCSQICTLKLNLQPKFGQTCNFYSKVFFGIFVLGNIFNFFLLNLNYWCFTTILWNFRKIEEAKLVENLRTSYLPYEFQHNLHSFLLRGKSENIWFLMKPRIKPFVHR